MQIVVVYNPRAGRGRGEAAARELADALAAAGHGVDLEACGPAASGHPTGPRNLSYPADHSPLGQPRPGSVDPVATAELVVAVGGDGTVHHLIDRLIPRRAALYHFPLGTENLFSREFDMRADPQTLLKAIAARRLKDVDVGVCSGRRFVLMASIGADAGVIRRLSATRTGAIRHRHYAGPIFAELCRPTLPRLSIDVDGKPLVVGRLGMVVVANSRHYALRLNPARLADMADGVLDVVFLPAGASPVLLARLVGARFRWAGPGVIRAKGAKIRIRAEGLRICAQIDGEAGPAAAAGGLDLEFSVERSALRVLLGPDAPGLGEAKSGSTADRRSR